MDFVCHAARLVVEVDGAQHNLTWAADGRRDAVLRAAGFQVIRFAAKDVTANLEGVVGAIRQAVGAASPLSPAPSPPEGGEGSDVDAASPRPRNGGEGQGEGGRGSRRTGTGGPRP